jgi:hypothetical protein
MEGNITIVRYSSTDRMEIAIEDKLSGTQFLRAELSAHDLMLALTGQGNIPIVFELRAHNVGKKAEHKTEWVPVPQFHPTDQEIDAALNPFEQDGWVARRSDLGNHHCHEGTDEGHKYQVAFTRFV